MKQFACAWVYDDRQILCFVWQDDDGQDYVAHMTEDPTLRVRYDMRFPYEEKAREYLSNIKHSRADVRRKIENTFDGIFEREGKYYENQDHPKDLEEEDQLLGGYDN
jgi:hypothetical protein